MGPPMAWASGFRTCFPLRGRGPARATDTFATRVWMCTLKRWLHVVATTARVETCVRANLAPAAGLSELAQPLRFGDAAQSQNGTCSVTC